MIYRLLYQLGLLLLRFLNGIHPKLQKGYQLRQKVEVDGERIYPWLNFPKHSQPIWFHCASGEFEYALPLIRKIKERDPQQKILVTYFTHSYLPRLSQEKLVDYLCPSPWDKPSVIRDFIEHHQPKALMIARTDVWSEMTEQCYKKKIPTIIFSMTFNKNINPLSFLFYCWQYRFIERFFVVADEDKKKLSKLFPDERIFVTGDTRYEQCLFRLENTANSNTKVDKSLLSKKVFIGGSLWPEDENVLVNLLKTQAKTVHWILVPHEIHKDRLEKLAEHLSALSIPVVYSSRISQWDGQGVLIVDEFGLLAHLYKIADLSLIGGSFRKSVHSVMESLATGTLTYVGPHYHNNREAEEFSKMETGFPLAPVQVVSSESFEEQFLRGLQLWDSSASRRLQEVFRAKARASDEIIKKLPI